MAIGRRVSEFNIDQFEGGCNYSRDLTNLASNESPNSMNIIFDGNSMYKRPGYFEITSSTGTGEYGYSLFDMGVTGSGRKLVAHFDDMVYKMDGFDLILDTIRTDAPATNSYNADVNQYLIQTYDDYSSEYYWDGSASTMSQLSGSAPGFKHVVEHQGYLLGANITTARLRVYYEDINTMIGGSYSDFFTLRGGRDDEITGWLVINGRAYATTKTGIFRVSFVGGVTVFEEKQVVSQTGMVPRTGQVVITEEFGEVAIFLGYDLNLYLFDGSFARNIGTKFRFSNNDTEIALDRLDRNYFSNFHAVYDSIKRVYRLFVTKKGDATNEYCLNINTSDFAYYPFDNMGFHAATIAQDNIGRRFLIGADYNGKLHKLFIDTNTDNGTVIKELYESPIVTPRPGVSSKAQNLNLLFNPVANYKLTFEDRTDLDKTWKERDMLPMYHHKDRFIGVNTVLGKTAYLGSGLERLYHQINIPVTQNMYRFRLHTDSTAGAVCQYKTGTVAGAGGDTNITGTGTTWTSDMTPANGWKIHIQDGVHANTTYDFTYVSATTATVSTMDGSSPGDDFAGASYELYRTGYAGCGRSWELMKIDYNSQALAIGKAGASNV